MTTKQKQDKYNKRMAAKTTIASKKIKSEYSEPISYEDVRTLLDNPELTPLINDIGGLEYSIEFIKKLDAYIDTYCPKDADRYFTFATFSLYIYAVLSAIHKDSNMKLVHSKKYNQFCIQVNDATMLIHQWCFNRQANGQEDSLYHKAKYVTAVALDQLPKLNMTIVNEDDNSSVTIKTL